MFIDAALDYVILEKMSTTAYQALWIKINLTGKKHIVCGIIYRQHYSPEQFQNYFADTVEKFISSGKTLCLMGEINIDLLKSTHCQYAHDFLSTLLRHIYTTFILGTALQTFGTQADNFGHGPLDLHDKTCSSMFDVDFLNGTPETRTALLKIDRSSSAKTIV